MKLEGEQVLLRVYLRNTDKAGWFSPPAAVSLVQRASRADWPALPSCAASSGWT